MPDDESPIPFLEEAPEPEVEFIPEVPVQEVLDAALPANDGLPTIEGHQVTLPEWRAFAAFCSTQGKVGEMVAAAAAAAGVVESTINDWRKRPWWNGLFELHVEDEQQAFHADLLRMREKATGFMEKILDGKLDETHARYANAGMSAVALLTRVGKKPLQDSRTVNQIQNNTINNSGSISVDNRKLEHATDDDMMKMITGEMPLPE